jgi:hypothetical protein
MSHVLAFDGQYFRVDIAEVVNPADPEKEMYVSWCSDAFKELKDAPSQSLSRFVAGPPLPTYAEARRHAHDWIRVNRDAQKKKRAGKAPDLAGIVYSVWLFKGESSLGFEFEEFSDAKAFAKAAEKSVEVTKVGITNNESPQYLTVWEKGPKN